MNSLKDFEDESEYNGHENCRVRFVCPFCDGSFSSREELFNNLAFHLDLPRCRSCMKYFKEAKSYINHGCNVKTNNLNTLFTEKINGVGKWVQDYIDLQETVIFRRLFQDHCRCFMCDKVNKIHPNHRPEPVAEKEDFDLDEHLRHHLAYYRYECKFCVPDSEDFIVDCDEDTDSSKMEFRCHFSKEFRLHLMNYHFIDRDEKFVDVYVRRELPRLSNLETLIADFCENVSEQY